MGNTWIKLLPLELQDVKNYFEPRQEIDEHDHVVAPMSGDLKRLFTLWHDLGHRAEQAKVDAKYTDNQNQDLESKADELAEKTKVIGEIFWIAVKDEYGLWDKPSIGIRKGFFVVWTDVKEGDNLPPFFRIIGG